ncbi:MAG TPA: LysE family transporter [Ohtaekwangia sp.]|nr:LysE family transporter [Ohtaekwangia sp.]
MSLVFIFLVAFFFSFVGSIPPGTINLTMLQLGLEKRMNIALRFALAAALIEYPYAWLAVKFANLITASPAIAENLQLFSAIVMIALGGFNLMPARKAAWSQKFNDSGFRRGIVIGILNPLALPFWVGMTAYLTSMGWIDLSSAWRLQAYLLGVFSGAFVLLMVLAYLAKKITALVRDPGWLKQIPGYILLALGLYALMRYLISNF